MNSSCHPVRTGSRRSAYTLAELLLLVALAAIAAAIFVDVRRQFSIYDRWIMSIGLSADGKHVIAGMMDGRARLWEVATGNPAGRFPPNGILMPTGAVAVSPDGSRAARARSDTVLEICDLRTGKILLNRRCGVASGVAFSADGKLLAYEQDCFDPNTLRIVDLDDSSVPDKTPAATNATTNGGTSMMSFSSDEKSLYLVKTNGDFVAWDIASGQVTTTSLVPPTKSAILCSSAALSPSGNQIAVVRSEYTTSITAAGAIQSIANTASKWFVDVFDPKSPGSATQLARRQDAVTSVAYMDSGKSLAILCPSGVEIWDPESLAMQKSVPSEQYLTHLTASRDGRVVAVANQEAIHLLEGEKLRKLVDLRPAESQLGLLLVAFAVVFSVWIAMRRRRASRTCPQCGKKWRERGRKHAASAASCPDCRMASLSTAEIAGALAGRRRKALVGFGLLVLLFVAMTTLVNWNEGDSILHIVGSLALWLAVAAAALVAFIIGWIWFLRRRLRALRRGQDYSVPRAQKAAASEGRAEQFGSISLWTDAVESAPPSQSTSSFAVSADSLESELQDCRQRIEDFLGTKCNPAEPMQLFVFANTLAAQKFLPMGGPNADRPAVYCGPWAHVGCLSLEAAHGLLVPPEQSLRALLAYHLAGWPRGQAGFWFGFALANYVGRVTLAPGADAWRRKVAHWAAEGTLLPLKELFARRTASVSAIGAKRMLPEHYQKSLRVIHQLLSLLDYWCGPDSTPQRRLQFQKLWQSLARTRLIEKACSEALGHSLAELDRQWQFWASKAKFAPTPPPPPEVAQAAEKLVIPLVRSSGAPIQRRIRAVRILGGSGWLVGAEALVQRLSDPSEDLRRESLAALRLMFGRVGSERADDWQALLDERQSSPAIASGISSTA